MLPRTSASVLAIVRLTISSAALALCQGPAYSQNYFPANCCHTWTGHVFYVSELGSHVHELYYNGAWSDNDLTAITNGPPAYKDITSFFDGSREHVFYKSKGDDHVRELYYNGGWWGNDLTAATNAPPASPPTSSFGVFYVGVYDRHVHELYYNGKWWDNDLMAATNGPYALQELTSFIAY